MSELGTATRRSIWAAAMELFTRQGYAATTVREIAGRAGVDPALVIRHFGSKETLFIETMSAALDDQPLVTGPTETLGEDFIRFVLDAEDQVRGVFLALVRASDVEGIAPQLGKQHELTFVTPLRGRLTGPDAQLRARLAAALVGGLLYALWVVEDEGLASADPESIVRTYGGLLQQLITPPDA